VYAGVGQAQSPTSLEAWALSRRQERLARRIDAIEETCGAGLMSDLMSDDAADMSLAELRAALLRLAVERERLDALERALCVRLTSLESDSSGSLRVV
jgi:predicted TPR repeat methyltransferase